MLEHVVMKMICKLYAADNGVTQQYERAFEASSAHLLIENVLYKTNLGGGEERQTIRTLHAVVSNFLSFGVYVHLRWTTGT